MLANLISGDRTLRGVDLETRLKRVSGGLQALGLAPGDVVAVLMRNDFAFVEVALGAERAGISMVPLNWHGSPDELVYVLEDSRSSVLFAHADMVARVDGRLPTGCLLIVVPTPPEVAASYRIAKPDCVAPAGRVDYENWLVHAPADVDEARRPAFRLLYTSGTTGKPKGVMRETGDSDAAERFALRVRVAHGLELRPIRAVMTGPLYHTAPIVNALNCVRYGELLVLQPKFDADDLLDLIERHAITHVHAVPTMFRRLLQLPEARRARFDPSSLSAVAHGAAMCPPDIKRAMIDWWGPVLREYYAATEVGIVAASTSQEWIDNPGTVGRPPSGVDIKIVDDNGRDRAVGEIGEILIRNDVSTLVSYRNLPDAVSEMWRGEWVTLGDVGYVNDAGFLWICDRKKDMVISGGVNIFPAEVEHVLYADAAVRDCVVFGVPDDDLGEALVACVELQPGAERSAKELQAMLADVLGRLRMPRVVEFVSSLPREDSGKLARRKVKATYVESFSSSQH